MARPGRGKLARAGPVLKVLRTKSSRTITRLPTGLVLIISLLGTKIRGQPDQRSPVGEIGNDAVTCNGSGTHPPLRVTAGSAHAVTCNGGLGSFPLPVTAAPALRSHGGDATDGTGRANALCGPRIGSFARSRIGIAWEIRHFACVTVPAAGWCMHHLHQGARIRGGGRIWARSSAC